VASAFAAAEPARVSRLVLVDSAGFNLAPEDRPWLLRVAGAPGASAVLEKLPVRRSVVRLALRQVFFEDRRVTPERVEEYLAPLARPGASRFLSRLLRQAGAMGLPEAIGRVRAPTLVVWCAEDEWVPVEDADRFVSAIPGARKAIIEGCGHLPQEERPQELLALLKGFLVSGGIARAAAPGASLWLASFRGDRSGRWQREQRWPSRSPRTPLARAPALRASPRATSRARPAIPWLSGRSRSGRRT
jgi:pimeloyl-ACP methyl ester carboxylesterase